MNPIKNTLKDDTLLYVLNNQVFNVYLVCNLQYKYKYKVTLLAVQDIDVIRITAAALLKPCIHQFKLRFMWFTMTHKHALTTHSRKCNIEQIRLLSPPNFIYFELLNIKLLSAEGKHSCPHQQCFNIQPSNTHHTSRHTKLKLHL